MCSDNVEKRRSNPSTLCPMFGPLVASSAKLQQCQAQVSMAYSHLATAVASWLWERGFHHLFLRTSSSGCWARNTLLVRHLQATGSQGMHFYPFVMDPTNLNSRVLNSHLGQNIGQVSRFLGNPLKQGRSFLYLVARGLYFLPTVCANSMLARSYCLL